MKTTYDKVADAVYIYLADNKKGNVKKTVRINENVLIDIGKNDEILGIEILGAKKYLNEEELTKAEKLVA